MINKRKSEQIGNYSLEGNNKFPRIERLIQDYWKCKPEVDIERAVIYTESYKESEGEDVLLRRAKAFRAYCEKREVRIPEHQLIVGDTAMLKQFREKIEDIVSAKLFEDVTGE